MTDAVMERQSPVRGEEDLGQYFAEIRRYPLLTAEQELELARRRDAGDGDAVKTLVNSNLRLVVSIAREYTGRGVPLLDLIQEGSIGLILAARKYEHERQLRFSTYASKWIRQRVGRYLENQGAAIRVPAHTAEKIRRLQELERTFAAEQQREPTAPELAALAGLSLERVVQLKELMPSVCSLDAPAGEEGNDSLSALLPGDREEEPQAVLIRQEMKLLLETLMAQLDGRQRTILNLRFGMEDGSCLSYEQIGKALGLSKERVRQIEAQAMKRLNKLGSEIGLEDFLG